MNEHSFIRNECPDSKAIATRMFEKWIRPLKIGGAPSATSIQELRTRMITLDITLIIQIVNILLLIGILNAVLYKPIRTVLAQREEKLAALENEIETFGNNVKLRKEEVNKQLNVARAKAKDVLEEARSTAHAASAETLAGIREEATAAKTEQLAAIQKDFAGAHDTLKGQVEGFAIDIAGKIMGRSL